MLYIYFWFIFLILKVAWLEEKKYALVKLEHVESWQTSKMIVLLCGTFMYSTHVICVEGVCFLVGKFEKEKGTWNAWK